MAKPESERDKIARIVRGMSRGCCEVVAYHKVYAVTESACDDIAGAVLAILARQTGEQDQGSSGGLGQPGSGSQPEADAGATAALAWLADNQNCELSFDYGHAEVDGQGWCVHRVNGGVNDREWTLIGTGETPEAAVLAAIGGGQ